MQLGDAHFTEEKKLKGKAGKEALYEYAKIYTTGLNDSPALRNLNALGTIKEQSILIIEDNHNLMNYLGNKFDEDDEVFLADSGEKGIVSAYEQVPDLIISDIVLPG
ncbi:hypothetical protein ACSBL2_09600 [Pedobacter sp. AW31-3R]|uniref:hypothetical protein n=1 Tax=Pedobacter sp. AW31-3R TaxID=3445781 RepID=UPI003F9FA634